MQAPGFHTARTLKQNMKKSLSDRVSCLVLACGDVSPSISSRMPLPPCSTAMSGWHKHPGIARWASGSHNLRSVTGGWLPYTDW